MHKSRVEAFGDCVSVLKCVHEYQKKCSVQFAFEKVDVASWVFMYQGQLQHSIIH